MGTVAIQTQCCLQERDGVETDEEGEDGAPEEKVPLVEPVPWHGRSGGGPAGPPSRAPATVPRRSDSETTLVPG